jgi:hypothetical protein
MQEQTKKTLRDAISEVLETMFFLCPEPANESQNGDGGNEVVAQIRTKGENPLRLVVALPEPLLGTMAQNALGETDEPPSPAALRDVACEVANMIAGAYVNRLDTTKRSPLSVPEILPGVGDTGDACAQCVTEVDGECVRAFLFQTNP